MHRTEHKKEVKFFDMIFFENNLSLFHFPIIRLISKISLIYLLGIYSIH